MSGRIKFLWIMIAIISALITLLVFLPASWLGSILEKQSNGRLSLGDTQGSFWNGSGFIGVAADKNSHVSPLFPGRFHWKISPILILGQIDVSIENKEVFESAVKILGDFSHWQLSPNSLILPSERLEGLGAPLNTIGPTGKLKLNWNQIDFTREQSIVGLQGKMFLEMKEMSSRISSIKPLGSYQLDFNWMGNNADLVLKTQRGPMMLEGLGVLQNGKVQFSGKAFAEKGHEENLLGLLNLLGRSRIVDGRQVIALEYK